MNRRVAFRNPRTRHHGKVQAHRVHHPQHGRKGRVAFLARRLVEALPRQPGFAGHFCHTERIATINL